jgi:hypothetical protein
MDDPTPLDADEILCRRCESPAGVPCVTPSGARSRTVHIERRRDAAAGIVPQPKEPRGNARSTGRKSPATSEGRSKGGKASAQARRRRRAEAAAEIERQKEAALAAQIEAQAVRLAEDAARYASDRAILRRQTLDAAAKSYTRLIEGLDGLQRIECDKDGRPVKIAEEYEDREGRTKVRMVPDVRGAFPASHVERLAKIAASTLNSLRLEEGKPTGIHETQGGNGAADVLGQAGVEELVAWAAENLPPGGSATP